MPVAIVTGASRGIGRAIAERLAAAGYDLFVVSRDQAALHELSKSCAADGRVVVTCSADLARADAPEAVYQAFADAYDRLDVLVNNAGVATSTPFGEHTAADWDLVMNLNARTPFFLTQLALPLLKRANPGYVVNIGSVMSKKGYALQSLYAASKHALLGFTKSLARETVDHNIRVHAVLPGSVNTSLITSVRPDIDVSDLISPEEVAEVVAGLLQMRGNAVIDEIEVRRRTKTPWA